jgi:hypothetical protein
MMEPSGSIISPATVRVRGCKDGDKGYAAPVLRSTIPATLQNSVPFKICGADTRDSSKLVDSHAKVGQYSARLWDSAMNLSIAE